MNEIEGRVDFSNKYYYNFTITYTSNGEPLMTDKNSGYFLKSYVELTNGSISRDDPLYDTYSFIQKSGLQFWNRYNTKTIFMRGYFSYHEKVDVFSTQEYARLKSLFPEEKDCRVTFDENFQLKFNIYLDISGKEVEKMTNGEKFSITVEYRFPDWVEPEARMLKLPYNFNLFYDFENVECLSYVDKDGERVTLDVSFLNENTPFNTYSSLDYNAYVKPVLDTLPVKFKASKCEDASERREQDGLGYVKKSVVIDTRVCVPDGVCYG